MAGYVQHGPAFKAFLMFLDMLFDHDKNKVMPDSFVLSVVLRACAKVASLSYGRQIHGYVLKRIGFIDSFVENALLNMYISCGSLVDADVVFAKIKRPDVVAWSLILSGYVKNGLEKESLKIFFNMILVGVRPDVFIFSIVIGACAHLNCMELGVQLHCYTIKTGFESIVFLANSLMDLYAKCGDVDGLRLIFSKMSDRNLVSWNTFLIGLVNNFYYFEALQAFRDLINNVSRCDDFSLTSVLKTIATLGDMNGGREVHGYIIRSDYQSNRFVMSSLLEMYIECIDYQKKDIPMKLFKSLKGFESDEFIIPSILKWRSIHSNLGTGKSLHSQIIKFNLKEDSFIISSLMVMYSKCGVLEEAIRVFQRVKHPGTAPWSVLIYGFIVNGHFREALTLFRRMQYDCVKANEFSLTSVLIACLALCDLKRGKQIHCKILRTGYGSNSSVTKTLINLYTELWDAKQVLKFGSFIPESDKACWKATDKSSLNELLHGIQLSNGYIGQNSVVEILNSSLNLVSSCVGKQAQAYMTKRDLISTSKIENSLDTCIHTV